CLEGREVGRRREPRTAAGLLEEVDHPHGRELGVRLAVRPDEAVTDLEGAPGLDGEELPVTAGALAVGSGHVVVGAAARGDVVPGEGRGPAGRAPELLDLAGVDVGVPEPADRHGE